MRPPWPQAHAGEPAEVNAETAVTDRKLHPVKVRRPTRDLVAERRKPLHENSPDHRRHERRQQREAEHHGPNDEGTAPDNRSDVQTVHRCAHETQKDDTNEQNSANGAGQQGSRRTAKGLSSDLNGASPHHRESLNDLHHSHALHWNTTPLLMLPIPELLSLTTGE